MVNVAQLKAFLHSPRVAYLSFQTLEINNLIKELRLEIQDTAKPKAGYHRMHPEKDPSEELGYATTLRVEHFVKEVLLHSGIDLMPELEAVEISNNILYFSPKLRLVY